MLHFPIELFLQIFVALESCLMRVLLRKFCEFFMDLLVALEQSRMPIPVASPNKQSQITLP